MPNFRRYFVPGGSYFFTVVTYRRARFLCDESARRILGENIRECQRTWPFVVNAMVLLPDHLHAIWSLPTGDDGYSRRWGWVKKEFTSAWLGAGGQQGTTSRGMQAQRRRGVWQPRFWEHTLRDENDFERHFDYIHYNPVKHRLVESPKDWPHSTFHRWVCDGVYDYQWGAAHLAPLKFDDIEKTAAE